VHYQIRERSVNRRPADGLRRSLLEYNSSEGKFISPVKNATIFAAGTARPEILNKKIMLVYTV
jgi:hypothetical protein